MYALRSKYFQDAPVVFTLRFRQSVNPRLIGVSAERH